MSDTTEKIEPMSTADLMSEAITALTATARKTRVIGAGTSNEHTEPIDFAEIACHVLTAVAANIGGVEELLAGRPGSWEAGYVRNIVESTAGADPDELRRYRTEPVRLDLDLDDAFQELGLYDLYESDADALATVVANAEDALWDAVATEDEKAQLAANIAAREAHQKVDLTEHDQTWVAEEVALYNEAGDIIRPVEERAAAAGHPAAVALAAARRHSDAVNALFEQDRATYVEAYTATARRVLEERGMSFGVDVVTEWREWVTDPMSWDDLADQLHQAAREQTPMPATGAAPDWTLTTPAESLRRAGLTYTARAQAADDGA